jgi:uncharacterized membrane protein YfhO
VLIVRNAYDSNWRATVDGRQVRVFPANYLIQGVRVPAGRHTVVLSYDDPAVGYGLLGSALSLLAVGVAAAFLSGRFQGSLVARRRKPRAEDGSTEPAEGVDSE